MIKGKMIFAKMAEDSDGYKFGLAQTKDGGLYLAYEGLWFDKFGEAEYAYNDITEESRLASVTHANKKYYGLILGH